jgi:hypothetical protein
VTDAAVATPEPAGAPPPSPKDADLPLTERLSDRLNPLLVRETQQAMRGRVFLVAFYVSLAAIVLLALERAAAVGASRRDGWNTFVFAMQVLLPILTFVVPLQAFLSMRQEVTGGTIEHLLLSRLGPFAIVRGKIAAAVVESLVFFSVFAPLVGLTYLLRGVDVPTIVSALTLAFVYGTGAVTFAIALGALSRWPAARALPLVVVALGLTVGTSIVTTGFPYLLRTASYTARAMEVSRAAAVLTWAMPAILGAPLLLCIGTAALAHPYENRSSGFRIYALLALVGGASWIAWLASRSSGRSVADAVPVFVGVAAIFAFPFVLFATTEEPPLSPRVRISVPKNPLLAGLAAPFLPGGGRGMLFCVLLAGLAVFTTWFVPFAVAGTEPDESSYAAANVPWAYVLLYAGLGRFVRSRFAKGPLGTVRARVAVPILVVVLAVGPYLLMAIGRLHRLPAEAALTNPFDTIHRMTHAEFDRVSPAVPWILAILVVLLHVPGMLRGVAEVATASAARRAREA